MEEFKSAVTVIGLQSYERYAMLAPKDQNPVAKASSGIC